jgi:uncharacterized protein
VNARGWRVLRTGWPVALLGLAFISGCVSPSPAVVFHTLRPMAIEANAAPKTAPNAGIVAEIMPVRLPELLQHRQIVIAQGGDSYSLSGTHSWGNTLETDLQQVLTENLSVILGAGPIVIYPDGERVKARYRISLDVLRCEGNPGGVLQFQGTWMVTQPSDGRMILLRRFNLAEPVKGGGIDDLVSAHSRVLNALSQEIAAELRALSDLHP